MSSFEQLSKQLTYVLAKVAEGHAALVQARRSVGESGVALTAIVDDTADSSLLRSISTYREIWYTTVEASKALHLANDALRTYMHNIGTPSVGTVGLPFDEDANPPSDATPPHDYKTQPNHIGEAFPEFATAEWAIKVGTGLASHITSGHAFDDEGRELKLDRSVVQSGPTGASTEIDRHLKSGVFRHHDPRGKIAVSEHVETKLAWYMSRQGISHLNVVINNTPCRGMFNCRRAVGAILPSGTSMTVWSAESGVRFELKGAER